MVAEAVRAAACSLIRPYGVSYSCLKIACVTLFGLVDELASAVAEERCAAACYFPGGHPCPWKFCHRNCHRTAQNWQGLEGIVLGGCCEKALQNRTQEYDEGLAGITPVGGQDG